MPRFSTAMKVVVCLFCVTEMYDFAIRTACSTIVKCNQFSMCRESQNNFLTAVLEKNTLLFP